MTWRKFQHWFNTAPCPDSDYILDKDGEKFWVTWKDMSESTSNLYIYYRGRKVGHLYLVGKENNRVMLADFIVNSKYRQRGLGKGLLELGIEWAKKRGYKNITGFMMNHDGLSEEYMAEWYRRQGFQVDAHKNITLSLQ